MYMVNSWLENELWKKNLKEMWKEHDLMNTMLFTIVFFYEFPHISNISFKNSIIQIRHFITSLPESFTNKCHYIYSVL